MEVMSVDAVYCLWRFGLNIDEKDQEVHAFHRKRMKMTMAVQMYVLQIVDMRSDSMALLMEHMVVELNRMLEALRTILKEVSSLFMMSNGSVRGMLDKEANEMLLRPASAKESLIPDVSAGGRLSYDQV